MKELKAGDLIAFDCLYRRYYRKIYQFSFRILKSSEDAENIVQDVFLTLFEKRLRIEKCSSVRCYIFTITYNSAVSQIRRKAKESRYLEYLKSIQVSSQAPADLQLEHDQLVDRLNNIVNSLPDRQREVYNLHRNKGLKYKEIASRMNLSVNTIENHMSRAIKKIRQEMSNYNLMGLIFCFLFL